MNTTSSTRLSFLLICLLIGFPQISETIYTPSLPSIAQDLSVSAHWVEWTLSIYFIGFALGVGYWGILADKIGRRPVMLLGIFLYCLATLGCYLASNIAVLLLCRAIQALGASVGSVITQTMIRDTFTGKERGRLFSLIGIPLSLAPAFGPLCGSWLDALFSWRANFITLLLMGILILLISARRLPETRPQGLLSSQDINLTQLCLQMCRDKKVLGAGALIAGINGILFSFYGEAPFMLIELMGLSANQYGWVGLAIALGGLLGSMLSHRLHRYLSSEQIIGLGCLLMLLGTALMVILACNDLYTSSNVEWGTIGLLISMFITIFGGMGLAIPNLMSIALSDYQVVVGRAGSIFGFGYYVLVALLTALMGGLHDGTVFPMPWYFLGLSIAMLVIYYVALWLPLKSAILFSQRREG
ncbi:MAG: hypothetical protein BGO43_09350 [Gammaproteobacteria bacterium 39-13]|mgnify:FL=1|nr:multidrug effflux MFS transporter [Gammaproteobacteria bacterium]OJV93847.1 MAG: hypothetical protein BGO43_09350 [Gammaproteobacteria bacterium 39-13]